MLVIHFHFRIGPWSGLIGSEDCLYVNVYVPDVGKREGSLPVLVWLHGGGFMVGDGSDLMYGPQYLLDRNVILVTVQYRLGPLGFLTLGNDILSGNQGVWDQRLALKWVRRNIEAFNGDPNRVTLFGESAGGFSVAYHLAAPAASEGLFRAAIIQSGSLDSPFTMLDRKKSMSNLHKEYAEAVGCPSDQGVLECLQSTSLETFFASALMFDECNLLREGKL